MNYELKILPNTKIAIYCWSGEMTIKDREDSRDHVMQFCQENSINHVILDTRQEINKTRTMQMFDFAAAIPEHMRGLRIAVIRQSDDGDIKFGEAVATNRGANLRTFLTLEDAQKWLESGTETPNKPDQGGL